MNSTLPLVVIVVSRATGSRQLRCWTTNKTLPDMQCVRCATRPPR